MRHIHRFNEAVDRERIDLPKSVDIDEELNILRYLEKEKSKIKREDTGDVVRDVINKIESKVYQSYTDREAEIEEQIKEKLWDIIMKYCEKGDYDGAKWFVGNSYKDMNTVGKVLLFRGINVIQRQNQNK
jgi:hypothetical protein